MINMGEGPLKCDLAETYHVYITDWYDPPFPLSYIADLAVGLRYDSRIKKILSHQNHITTDLLLALVIDKLSILAWQNTKDGHKGRNIPKSLYQKLAGLEENKKDELESFTMEEYQKWYDSHHS